MNYNDTLAPDDLFYSRINDTIEPAEKWPCDIEGNSCFQMGEFIGDNYIITGAFENGGRQSKLYYVKKSGRTFLLKVYNSCISDETISFIKKCQHSNIVSIVENDIYHNNYYEIMDYYAGGDLSNNKYITKEFIKNKVISSINNGLHYIHSKGFLHRDIKPSNILINEKNDVVITDFGSMKQMNYGQSYICEDDGYLGQTIGYIAPLIKYPDGKIGYDTSCDYYSFGATLYELFCGWSFYDMLTSESYKNEGKIIYPHGLDDDIIKLLNGLLDNDNNKRWDYIKVEKWIKEIIYKEDVKNSKMVYANKNGETIVVSNLEELAEQIINNWDCGRNITRRIYLKDFIRKNKPGIIGEVSDLRNEINQDIALFKLLYLIKPVETIYFRDVSYSTVNDYLNSLRQCDENARFILENGLFVFYLRSRGIDENIVNRVAQIIENSRDDINLAVEILYKEIKGDNLIIHNRIIDTLDLFIDEICMLSINEIFEVFNDKEVLAWLYRNGVNKKILFLEKQ